MCHICLETKLITKNTKPWKQSQLSRLWCTCSMSYTARKYYFAATDCKVSFLQQNCGSLAPLLLQADWLLSDCLIASNWFINSAPFISDQKGKAPKPNCVCCTIKGWQIDQGLGRCYGITSSSTWAGQLPSWINGQSWTVSAVGDKPKPSTTVYCYHIFPFIKNCSKFCIVREVFWQHKRTL